ncbi:MAG: lytic transglycosylase domain-containing protein [Clostridia bacterium]|nr:lytic transglycosylase domain-containing protein [Clostridia bacterium]
MTKKRKKKKSGCVGFAVVILILVLCVAVFIYGDMFSKIRIGIEHRIYPLKYEQEIIKAGEKYDLEPQLIAAVIYSESKFQEDATSSVGAMGLMQLMPETFQWLCDKRGEEHSSVELYDPFVNIDYGSYYLSWLYEHFGDIYTACAAYNAGIGAVEGWLESDTYTNDGVTLSYIPYGETSNYVAKIQNAVPKYNELYFDNNQY